MLVEYKHNVAENKNNAELQCLSAGMKGFVCGEEAMQEKQRPLTPTLPLANIWIREPDVSALSGGAFHNDSKCCIMLCYQLVTLIRLPGVNLSRWSFARSTAPTRGEKFRREPARLVRVRLREERERWQVRRCVV